MDRTGQSGEPQVHFRYKVIILSAKIIYVQHNILGYPLPFPATINNNFVLISQNLDVLIIIVVCNLVYVISDENKTFSIYTYYRIPFAFFLLNDVKCNNIIICFLRVNNL